MVYDCNSSDKMFPTEDVASDEVKSILKSSVGILMGVLIVRPSTRCLAMYAKFFNLVCNRASQRRRKRARQPCVDVQDHDELSQSCKQQRG